MPDTSPGLRALAEKATRGPWTRKNYNEVRADREGAGWTQAVATVHNEAQDADYIAALSPEVVIGLLDRLEALEKIQLAAEIARRELREELRVAQSGQTLYYT